MKKKISFQNLLNENYDLITRLEVLNWMLKTGKSYEESKGWARYGVDQWLFGYSANNHQSHTNLLPDVHSKIQLAFVRAIIKTPHYFADCIAKWRQDNSIYLHKARMIEINDTVVSPKDRYQPRWGKELFTQPYSLPEIWVLRQFLNRPLKKEFFQPDFQERTNPYFVSCRFSTVGNGFRIEYRYSFENTLGSDWGIWFHQDKNESLDEFVNRTLFKLDSFLLC